jgi:hypothetical protein
VHGDSADIPVSKLALAGVESRTDLDAQRAHLLADRACAVDAPCRPVEGREDAVARGFYLPTAVPVELTPDEAVVLLEQIAPASVAERRGAFGRLDYVGEEHGRKGTVGLALAALACQELLGLVDDLIRVAGPGPMVVTRQLDEARARDLLCEPARSLDRQRVAWGQNRLVSTPTGAAFAHDLYLAHTQSRGRRWSRPKRIYEARPGVWVFDNEVIVTGRRRLVCIFSTVETNHGVEPLLGGRITYRALRSRDGGRSWSAPSRIAETRMGLLSDRERGTTIRAHGMVFSADGGPQGRLYVAWQDVRSSGSSRILLSTSRGGRRWSPPRVVSRGAKRPFIPDLAVARDGTVGVRFYDLRRDRPGDAALTTDSLFRHSHDGGRHWREARLGGSFDLRTAPLCLGGRYLGLYQALVAQRGGFATAFTRARAAAREGPTDIFFARIKLRR